MGFMLKSHARAVMVMLSVISLLQAATFYVSPSGSDATGDGSSGKPWKTLAYACTHVTSGQANTIELATGTFVETSQIRVQSGTTIRGKGIDSTIIAGTGFLGHLISGSGQSNLTLYGMTLDGVNKKHYEGIQFTGGENIVIHDVRMKDFDWKAINLYRISNFKMYRCSFFNCTRGTSATDGSNLDFTSLYNSEIHDVVIRQTGKKGGKGIHVNDLKNVKMYNLDIEVPEKGMWNNGVAPAITIEFWGEPCTTSNVEIYNSKFNNNFSLSKVFNPSGGQALRFHHNHIKVPHHNEGYMGYALEITCKGVEIDHNFFEGGNYCMANWLDEWKTDDIKVHHNIFWGIDGYQGQLTWAGKNVITNFRFENNTVSLKPMSFAATGHYHPIFKGLDESTQTIRNNVFIYESPSKHLPFGTGPKNVSNNAFYHVDASGTNVLALNSASAIQMNGAMPDPWFRLTEMSPCINAGINIPGITDEYYGKAPDIGAYEFGSITTGIQKNVLKASIPAQSDSRKMTRLFNLLGRTYSSENSVKRGSK